MTVTLHSKAPTRIDLAGGTVDIWPLYLFLNQPRTINLGIDLFAETWLDENSPTARAQKVSLRSGDQSSSVELSWQELDSYSPPPFLELHVKLLRHFKALKQKLGRFDASRGMELTTRAQSPAGAGLGGSSTLSVSMVAALQHWATGSFEVMRDGKQLIEIVRDIETTVIQVPAGMQDYYGAMFGGLQSIHWLPGTIERNWLDPIHLSELQKRLLLFYSGQSRNSGINNWALFKGLIDRQGEVKDQFGQIVDATANLETALLSKDYKKAGQAIAQEWRTRKQLAAGITTPLMDQAFEAAMQAGASAGKICGAGGGGCFFVYLDQDSAQLREQVKNAVLALDPTHTLLKHLPFGVSPHGVQVTVQSGAAT